MVSKKALSPEQNIAANPELNVWVQANAGTGKTSVLVQRLLRILFRTDAGSHRGILCLTYTNAGAAEMRNRVLASLREWAFADDDQLRDLLRDVAPDAGAADNLTRAREIFYEYIDNPDMLRVRTIHSFAQDILRRFPIEAGIPPAWSLATESDITQLRRAAFQNMINRPASREITDAFDHMVNRISEYKLDELTTLLSDQYRFMFNFNNDKQFIDTINNFIKLNPNAERGFIHRERGILLNDIANDPKPTKTNIESAEKIKKFIAGTIDFDEYKTVFLTATGQPRAKMREYMLDEQSAVYEFDQNRINERIRDDSIALFHLSRAFSDEYKKLKLSRGLLDFDDIILYTNKLFSDPAVMGWVLSQLDSDLSHILVDEAQDTSPEQWAILRNLATNFFTIGDGENPRSLFVVGDAKQSIFSFQGASPSEFSATRETIGKQLKSDMRDIREIPLAQSFRSVAPILQTVDHFFNGDAVHEISGFNNNPHTCFRENDTGTVTISPLQTKDKEDGENASRARIKYIKSISDHIETIVKNEKYSPHDIMVLVQKRHPFVAPLVAELKSRDIPVAGSDRIKLQEFMPVRDLLNLARFVLNPADDYALCCALKSPLFRFSEDDLYNVCHNRPATVFESLEILRPEIHTELTDIIAMSDFAPYSFFMRVLNTNERREKMIAAMGDQMIDPTEEFLTIALSYERTRPGGLQRFLEWFLTGSSEVKRDMETGAGVRIMTVHASKGLDAPVVFLIDTTDTPESKRAAMNSVPIIGAFLWSPDGKNSEKYATAAAVQTFLMLAEYYRLLYVAMTRARDELHIYGFTKNTAAPENSWFAMLYNSLQSAPNAMINDDGIVTITNMNT